MPLTKVKSPGSVNAFNDFFAEIATFDIIDTEPTTMEIIYFPEMDAFSGNFFDAGYDSFLIIPCLGTMFYMLGGHVLLIVLSLLVYLLARAIKKLQKLHTKLNYYLYFNGLIRLYVEVFFDVALFAFLNLKHVDWSTPFMGV